MLAQQVHMPHVAVPAIPAGALAGCDESAAGP
jgi:hypothetical protein